jgi:hypothetical protein
MMDNPIRGFGGPRPRPPAADGRPGAACLGVVLLTGAST